MVGCDGGRCNRRPRGDRVKILGSGGPFGTRKIVLAFNSDDKITKIEAGPA